MAVATGDRRLRYRLWAAYWSTPAHRVRLWGRAPKALALSLDERWPGDPRRGEAIIEGSYRFAGETVASADPPWAPGLAGADWQAELHGFAWVADLAAVASEAATGKARALLKTWIERHERWHPLVWRADVMGERLYAWVAYAEFLAPEAGDPELRRAFLKSLSRQARHLRRSAGWEVIGLGRFAALKGLLAAETALAAKDRELDGVLQMLEAAAKEQILPDGGHRARSPAAQLAAIHHLIDARAALYAARIEVPQPIHGAIDRAAPMLRFFRHGDGRLALFNDSQESEPAMIDLVLARSEAKGRAPASAPMSGFERLAAGKSIVIADCGPPASEQWGAFPHAGTLSFEMSHGRERLIVNCGTYRGPKSAWHAALRTTAAHSTLIVADKPSAELDAEGHILKRPHAITRERAEQDGSQWISTTHDGYKAEFGLTHQRQLFLAEDGEDLRGEDRLTGKPGQSFTIRFHLHPQVQASLTQDGTAALLRLASGVGWRLRAQGAVLSLAESIYLGTGEIRKTQQIVLQGHVGTQGATVKWGVRREGK